MNCACRRQDPREAGGRRAPARAIRPETRRPTPDPHAVPSSPSCAVGRRVPTAGRVHRRRRGRSPALQPATHEAYLAGSRLVVPAQRSAGGEVQGPGVPWEARPGRGRPIPVGYGAAARHDRTSGVAARVRPAVRVESRADCWIGRGKIREALQLEAVRHTPIGVAGSCPLRSSVTSEPSPWIPTTPRRWDCWPTRID